MLLEQTWNYIKEYQLIFSGETILVGVSGGADSVCLLLLLSELGKEHGFSVQAVHVNHNLRGQESEGDQLFVEAFCESRGIPLHCYSYQVEDLALEWQLGIEETGRKVRSLAFKTCMEKLGAQKTALAHHRNDQAETVLFRLARGSSLTGLSGIRPLQGWVIHPLLFAGKKEILAELEARGVEYRTDSSNLTDHYTRNCIRNQVMPVLEERVNRQAVLHIAQAAEDMAEAEEYLREQAAEVGKQCIFRKEEYLEIREEGFPRKAVLQRYVLMDALSMAADGRKDLGRDQLLQLADLMKGKRGRRISLPGKLEAVRTPQGILLSRITEQAVSAGVSSLPCDAVLKIREPGSYTWGNWKLDCELLSSVPSEIPEKTYTKWLDYDKIKHSLEFRTRRSGDVLVTTESGGHKKLKSYFIDEKIPAEQRKEIPLLVSESRVFWVVGHRISEDCKVTAQTKQVLKITVSEDKS